MTSGVNDTVTPVAASSESEERNWTEVGAGVADRLYVGAITGSALAVPIMLGLIFVAVGIAAWPALRAFGVGFVTSSDWNPVASHFGAAPAIYGTIVSSIIALIIATPLALGVAIFLVEFAP